jgi:hypothetical protein
MYCLCEDVDREMNEEVEIFVACDVHAEKNESR